VTYCGLLNFIFCKDNTNCIQLFGFKIFLKWANLRLLLNVQKPSVSALGGFTPLSSWPGVLPLDPTGGFASDSHYRGLTVVFGGGLHGAGAGSNPNKIIIIYSTALRIALVTPCKSVCTGTVTHSDWRSDNLGQKLIPSDQWFERCVKLDRFRLLIWTYNYRKMSCI